MEVVAANLERSCSAADELREELTEKDRALGASIGRAEAANELLKAFGASKQSQSPTVKAKR